MSAEEAKRIIDSLKVMDEDSKTLWYVAEKRKREQEDKMSKRTFNAPKGEIKQEHVTGDEKRDLDLYDTFEDFALRQIQLKRCENEAGAAPLRDEALKAPSAQVIIRRGVKCLGRFGGVQVARVEMDVTTSGTREGLEIQSAEQLTDFLQSSVSVHERAAKQAIE